MKSGLITLLATVLLTVGLLVAAGAFSATSFFFNLLVPLPVAILTLRQGASRGIPALVLSAALIAAIGEPDGVILYLVQFGIASILLPLLFRRNWRWDAAVAGTAGIVTGTALLALFVYAGQSGSTVQDLVAGYTGKEIAGVKEVYSAAQDLSADQKETLFAALDQAAAFTRRVWPAFILLLSGLLLLLQTLFLSRMPATRPAVPGPAFADWRAPELLVWPLILAGFAVIFANGTVQSTAIALLIVLLPIYYLQGLAVATAYFERRSLSPWLRALGYMLMLMLNPLPLIVAGIGIFDLWFDFRTPRVKPDNS